MNEIIKNTIKTLKSMTCSEIIYFFKISDNIYSLLFYEGDAEILIDLEKDFDCFSAEITKDLTIAFRLKGFNSILDETFSINNSQFYLFSAYKKEPNQIEFYKEIQNKISALISKLISENETISLAYKDYFHLFTNSTNDIVFTLDKSGTIEFANKTLLDQTHYRFDDILEKHFFELLSERSKAIVSEGFQKLINTNSAVKFETEIIPKVGIEQLYEITLTPIFKDEKIISLFGVGTNLSKSKAEKGKIEDLLSKLTEANRLNAIERDRAQQQISVLNELNNLKNEFISNVSHELRTPLASIIGFAETISEDKNLTLDKAEEFNQVILEESKRLAKLINDVLDFSELENEKQKLQKSSLNIIEIINECSNNIKKESDNKHITLSSRIPQSEIMIYADEERIKKVISYILSNALKFTKENGRITIVVQEFLKEVEIVISDTGIGIPEQNIPLLFDKFSKVKRTGFNLTGAGFGLVTVKQIIDLHKGLIRVKSEVNKGTSFIIRLPKYSFN